MNLCSLFLLSKEQIQSLFKAKEMFTDFKGLETQSGTFHPSVSKPLTFTQPKQDYCCVNDGITEA